MLDFITNLIPGVGPAIYALIVAAGAVVWGIIHGGAKKREGIKLGQAKAENFAIKKDLKNANRIEVAADAARANDHGSVSTDERLTATGRVRKPKDVV